MAHPIWKGHISFGLMYIPVTLQAAEKRKELAFTLVDARDKAKIRYDRINEKTGKEVPWESIVKAYAHKGHLVLLEEDDFERVAVKGLKTIEIEHFVPEEAVSPLYFEKPYYISPNEGDEKGYVLLREALACTKKIGIAKVVIRTRQYLAAIVPYKNVLVLDLMRFAYEVRENSGFGVSKKNTGEKRIKAKELEIAEQLINAMTVAWNPKLYHDEYHEALLKLIAKKEKGVRLPKVRATKLKKEKVAMAGLLQKSLRKMMNLGKKHQPMDREHARSVMHHR